MSKSSSMPAESFQFRPQTRNEPSFLLAAILHGRAFGVNKMNHMDMCSVYKRWCLGSDGKTQARGYGR
jgi:hypothetical protein